MKIDDGEVPCGRGEVWVRAGQSEGTAGLDLLYNWLVKNLDDPEELVGDQRPHFLVLKSKA